MILYRYFFCVLYILTIFFALMSTLVLTASKLRCLSISLIYIFCYTKYWNMKTARFFICVSLFDNPLMYIVVMFNKYGEVVIQLFDMASVGLSFISYSKTQNSITKFLSLDRFVWKIVSSNRGLTKKSVKPLIGQKWHTSKHHSDCGESIFRKQAVWITETLNWIHFNSERCCISQQLTGRMHLLKTRYITLLRFYCALLRLQFFQRIGPDPRWSELYGDSRVSGRFRDYLPNGSRYIS